MAMIVKTDGTRTMVQGDNPDGTLSLKNIQEAVGGYAQGVPCDPEVTGGYDHYYCHDEGELIGLEINQAATKLSTFTADTDMVVGDVVFCRGDGEGGSL